MKRQERVMLAGSPKVDKEMMLDCQPGNNFSGAPFPGPKEQILREGRGKELP